MRNPSEFITTAPRLISLTTLEKSIGKDRILLRELIENKEIYYKQFIKKYKSGKERLIDNPTGKLKSTQKLIQKNILSKITFHESIFGGVKGRSNIDNAAYHKDSRIIITLDLKGFFPSVGYEKVEKAFKYTLGYGADVSNFLTEICCRGSYGNGYIPQGAATSTLMANLAFLPVYKQIKLVTDSEGLKLSSFVDDLTISGNDIDSIAAVIDKVINTIYSNNYKVSQKKLTVRRKGKEITGVNIDGGHLKPTKDFSKKVKMLRTKLANETISDKERRTLQGMANYKKSIRSKIASNVVS